MRQLEHIDGSSVLSRVLTRERGALWKTPKAMIFADSNDKGYETVLCLPACLCKRLAKEAAEMAAQPFSTDLESSMRAMFMQQFINDGTRILVAPTLRGWASMCRTWTSSCSGA